MAITPDTLWNLRQCLHSLAQPLAGLTGLVDLLLLEMEEADPRLPEVRQVSEQLENVLRVISEMRRLVREAAAPEAAGRAPGTQPGL